MTDDLYVRMCEKSPVQKDWKRKLGDSVYSNEDKKPLIYAGHIDYPEQKALVLLWSYAQHFKPDKKFIHSSYFIDKCVWLPRQEDWQDIYEKKEGIKGAMADFCEFCRVSNFDNEKYKLSLVDWVTIHWCLFVHREVYKLNWDWDENKWVKK